MMRMLLCLAGAVLLIASMTGCEKEDNIQHDTNLPPRVSVTSGPAEGATHVYTVHMHWHGWDEDGYVASYEFAWDDTSFGNWHRTTRTDSVFKVRIDAAGQVQEHTFYVKAIDNGGKKSPSTAARTFFARTESPYLRYLGRIGGCYFGPEAPPDSSCPGSKIDSIPWRDPVRFIWSGTDPDGPHSSLLYSYALDGIPTDWIVDTTQAYLFPELRSGSHKFSVTVKDEVGSESVAEDYDFVYNLDPQTEILSIAVEGIEVDWQSIPPDSIIVIPYNHRVSFHWKGIDPETSVWNTGFSMDGEAFKWYELPDCPKDTMTMWYDSKEPGTSINYIDPQPNSRHGNRPHTFRVASQDSLPNDDPGYPPDYSGRLESTPASFTFLYNNPPVTEILYPGEGDTVGPSFEIRWRGDDSKDNYVLEGGVVEEYLYSLNSYPDTNATSLRITSDTVKYLNMDPEDPSQVNKLYKLKLRAKDNAGTWEWKDKIRRFYVLDHEPGSGK
jgi:hypothetical protein